MRRSFGSKATRALLFLFVLWNALDVYLVRRGLSSEERPTDHHDAESRRSSTTQRIFIASNSWNNAGVLYEHWIPTVLDLTTHLGPDNVFVSIVESGSYDNTKEMLQRLDHLLESAGVPHSIVLDDTTHADELNKPPAGAGWIPAPNGTHILRRIPYLSAQRNRSLQPLHAQLAQGNTFDRILFLNDVVFTTQDVQALLATNAGDYAAACSLDFSRPPQFYDTFALRDAEGHEALMPQWPYFRASASRRAMKAHRPVPVTSCWNGMVSMDPAPFYASPSPLQFRGVPDTLAQLHVEASECCLIHTDNPLSHSSGVFVNPRVRVGYSGDAYAEIGTQEAYGRVLSHGFVLRRLWENRVRRWGSVVGFKEGVMRRRVEAWRAEGGEGAEERVETGRACLINEMQALTWFGWAHV